MLPWRKGRSMMIRRAWMVAALATLALGGCSDQDTNGPDGSALTEAGTGLCAKGTSTEVGRLCVRGETTQQEEQILEDKAVRIQVFPKGCFSSSCTKRHITNCSVTSGTENPVLVDALFCLEGTGGPGVPCSADCNGGGWAECKTAGLSAGTYTVKVGSLSVEFDVPSTMPHGGTCAGAQF
jgi:hypothetical protein